MSPANKGKHGREEKRAAILAAALELFAEQGYHGTNVPQIAGQAQISVGTLYHYFANKEAIVNELYRELKRDAAAAISEGFPTDAPAPEIFRVWWQRAVAWALAHPQAFRFLELHHHAPYLDAESQELIAHGLAVDHRNFEAGRQAGVLRPLPDAVLVAFIGGAMQALVKAAWQGQVNLTPDLVDQAAACCWAAIGNPGTK